MINKAACIKMYNEVGKLPEKHVPCTVCNRGVTMFSSNLTNRVERFGGVENLLNNFKCKSCATPAKVVKPKIRKEKKAKKIAVEAYRPIYRGHVIKTINLNEDKNYVIDTCWRPDLYLNADRTCDDCSLYNKCQASVRKLSKRKQALINAQNQLV